MRPIPLRYCLRAKVTTKGYYERGAAYVAFFGPDTNTRDMVFPACMNAAGRLDWPTNSLRGCFLGQVCTGPGFWAAALANFRNADYQVISIVDEVHNTPKYLRSYKFGGLKTVPETIDGYNAKKLSQGLSYATGPLHKMIAQILHLPLFVEEWEFCSEATKAAFLAFVVYALSDTSNLKPAKQNREAVLGWFWSLCLGKREGCKAHDEWWNALSFKVSPTVLFPKAAKLTNGTNYIMLGNNRKATERFMYLLRTDADKELWAFTASQAILTG